MGDEQTTIAKPGYLTRNGRRMLAPLSHGQKKRRMKMNLFDEHKGKCEFCQRDMILAYVWSPEKPQPQNLAVLLHLDSRYSRDRGAFPGERRNALVCRKCADERSRQNEISQPIEELHRRSGRCPAPAQP